MGAATEMRIATAKPFAAPPEKDLAPARRIVRTSKKAGSVQRLRAWRGQDTGASADDNHTTANKSGVTDQGVAATIKDAGATEKSAA